VPEEGLGRWTQREIDLIPDGLPPGLEAESRTYWRDATVPERKLPTGR
jgi:hypothetical protein